MSLSAFIPSEVVGAMVLEAFQKKIVAADLVSRNYEPLLSKAGDSTKIATLEALNGSDYTKNQTVTYSSIDATSQLLTIDQDVLFARSIDKIDTKQAALAILPQVVNAASYVIASGIDNYLINTTMSGNAGITGGTGAAALGTNGSEITVYSSGCLNYLGRLSQRLDESDVPYEGRWIIAPPWFTTKLSQQQVLQTYTNSDNVWSNGRVGRCMGFDIRTSTIIPNANVTTSNMIFAGHISAIEYAGYMVDNRIGFDMETKVAEGVRMLYVYGAKAVRTTALALGFIAQGD